MKFICKYQSISNYDKKRIKYGLEGLYLTISKLINNGLVSKGRLFCFSVELKNVPGELLKISEVLAKENANVVKLEHNQFKAINRIHNVLLEVTVETNGQEHIEKIVNSFEKEKYSIKVMY